jgi:hypothetical protein
MAKFDALASWREGTSDRSCNEPNGRGDTVAQDDDLPIAWRAATGGTAVGARWTRTKAPGSTVCCRNEQERQMTVTSA